MIEFLGEPGRAHANWPLAAGLHAPAFQVEDLEQAIEVLAPASFDDTAEVDSPIHPRAKPVSGEAPARLRFELWQES